MMFTRNEINESLQALLIGTVSPESMAILQILLILQTVKIQLLKLHYYKGLELVTNMTWQQQ